jgi:hypothetical protein
MFDCIIMVMTTSMSCRGGSTTVSYWMVAITPIISLRWWPTISKAFGGGVSDMEHRFRIV